MRKIRLLLLVIIFCGCQSVSPEKKIEDSQKFFELEQRVKELETLVFQYHHNHVDFYYKEVEFNPDDIHEIKVEGKWTFALRKYYKICTVCQKEVWSTYHRYEWLQDQIKELEK